MTNEYSATLAANNDVPDGSIRNHAYVNSGKVIVANDKAMTVAYGYGCKVCGRSILDCAHD